MRQRYLDHLALHGDGWARELPVAHLTASSLICAPVEQQVLLTLHAKIGRWLQTGGHLEADDLSLEDAALREAREESGLHDLRLLPDPLMLSRHQVSCEGRQAFHLDVQFLVLASGTPPPTVGAESLDVRWFALPDLPPVDGSVRDLVQVAAERLGWPVSSPG